MHVLLRFGLFSGFVIFFQCGAMGGEPASASSIGPEVVAVATGAPLSLRAPTGRFIAVHFIPTRGEASDRTADAEFVRALVKNSGALAGLREVFVIERGEEEAREWAKQYGAGVSELYVDSGGAFASEFKLGGTPATVVLDPAGTELFRRVGETRQDRWSFGAFEQRFIAATRASAILEYNLPKGQQFAVDGYDVVSYFSEGKATKGKPALASTFRGVKYQFASEANRAAFAKDPEKYLPTYGGWCATAMGAKGTKVEIDPTNFKVAGGRLFLFYKDFFSDAKKDWNKREAELEPAADGNWENLTGEHAPAR